MHFSGNELHCSAGTSVQFVWSLKHYYLLNLYLALPAVEPSPKENVWLKLICFDLPLLHGKWIPIAIGCLHRCSHAVVNESLLFTTNYVSPPFWHGGLDLSVDYSNKCFLYPLSISDCIALLCTLNIKGKFVSFWKFPKLVCKYVNS